MEIEFRECKSLSLRFCEMGDWFLRCVNLQPHGRAEGFERCLEFQLVGPTSIGDRMKIARAVSLGFALIGSSLAHGQSPAGTAQADFEFRTIPIEGANSSVHSVTPYRLFDTLVVTVSDPVLCGQKPLQPAVTIEKNRVSLSYKLTAAVAIGKPCTVVSEFIVKNLPNQDFEVAFSGGQEPYVVATMRKCPFYNPKAHDLWECLAPG